MDLELGGGLDNVFDVGGVADARQLHEYLVVPEAVLLDYGLGDA